MIMNKSLKDLGIHPHYVIVDKFSGRPYLHSSLTSDLTTTKKNITSYHRNEVWSNENLYQTLEDRKEFDMFIARLDAVGIGYDRAVDVINQRYEHEWQKLDKGLRKRLNVGVVYGLLQIIERFERELRENRKMTNQQLVIDVLNDLTAFREACKVLVEVQPIPKKAYKWEKLKSIEILEVKGLEF
ncbi:hypothetical protein Erwinia_phage_Tian_00066 [Erwinia phage Tian]|nr:hypothetical protein Erwinia_phage_Panisse_00020 [Erwinia phage Panisse]WJN64702.1 hypothetical protein Erwinia_phage_Pistou_00065 [Erwinia phage Pistou]WJN64981.1 hypothetical protein Erwinia_phage_Tian_00066 [Erwinia phage Tian]